MSDFVSEQKLMKTTEFYEAEQMFIITNGLIRFGHSSLFRRGADKGLIAGRHRSRTLFPLRGICCCEEAKLVLARDANLSAGSPLRHSPDHAVGYYS
jgi:hypothetical protein